MSFLLYLKTVSYTHLLRELCNCSDGNIATHTKKLVSAGFIDVKKEFVNNKPKTTYNLTEYGQKEFKEYIKFLKKIIEETEK